MTEPTLRVRLLEEARAGSRPDQFAPGLTGLRALAALGVFAFHVFAIGGPRPLVVRIGGFEFSWQILVSGGWVGAIIFFVLSAFLLSLPFVAAPGPGAPGSTKRFLLRRVKRVVPAYWVQLAILVPVLLVSGTVPPPGVVAAHLAFLQNADPAWQGAINAVYWTLPTEFGFYLLLPLFAWLAVRIAARHDRGWLTVCAVLIAAAIAFRYLCYHAMAERPVLERIFWVQQLPGMLDVFAFGMLAAWVFVRVPVPEARRAPLSNALVAAGLVGIVVMLLAVGRVFDTYWSGNPLMFFWYSLVSFFIACLIFGTALGGPLARVLFANRIALFLGIVSYSLYLWHFPITQWTARFLDRWGVAGDRMGWLIAIAVPATIVASALSYWFVERRFLRKRGP